MKLHNLRYGCRRIAMQIMNAFGLEVSKDLVRHILNKHFTGLPSGNGKHSYALVDIFPFTRRENITNEPKNALNLLKCQCQFQTTHSFPRRISLKLVIRHRQAKLRRKARHGCKLLVERKADLTQMLVQEKNRYQISMHLFVQALKP